MIFKNFVGYLEGMDLSTVPLAYLSYPSKNVIVHKGTAYTRPGITNDGNAPTSNMRIIGERTWKDALGGEKPLRVIKGGSVQVKWGGKWITIYTGVSSTAVRVRLDTWIDDSGAIIKKRIFFVDGTDAVYEWNGAIGTVGSVDSAGHSITISESSTLQKLGFDSGAATKTGTIATTGTAVVGTGTKFATEVVVGDVIHEAGGQIRTVSAITDDTHLTVSVVFSPDVSGVAYTVQPAISIVRFSGGVVVGTDTLHTDDDMTDTILHFTAGFANVPSVGDLVIGGVLKHTTILAGVNKDEIYTYKNHIGVANLKSISVYFSNAETKLDFVIPAANARTALSPFLVNLDQNFTAMISRFDAALKETVLWISSVDDWLKVIALDTANSQSEWVDVQQVQEAESTGAIPFCVAGQKGDIIFLSQDGTLQRITTVDVLAKDTLLLLSDEVETLLPRLDTTEARLYYLKRYIYIVYPAEGIVVALDVVENHFQPPWTLPVQSMSVIGGVLHGHSNARDETFSMLTGTNDLGSEIESVFAFGYYQGFQFRRGKTIPQDFYLKEKNNMGIGGRISPSTKVSVEEFFETDGQAGGDTFVIDGSQITTYTVPDDEGWATHLWASASYGAADDPADANRKFYAFRSNTAVPWFEWRMILTASGKDQQFRLLGLFIDDSVADTAIPENLYIPR